MIKTQEHLSPTLFTRLQTNMHVLIAG